MRHWASFGFGQPGISFVRPIKGDAAAMKDWEIPPAGRRTSHTIFAASQRDICPEHRRPVQIAMKAGVTPSRHHMRLGQTYSFGSDMGASLNFRASGSVRRHCPLPFLLLPLFLVSLVCSVVLSPSLCSHPPHPPKPLSPQSPSLVCMHACT